MKQVEIEARSILKPVAGATILTEYSDHNLVTALIAARDGRQVLFMASDAESTVDDRIEEMARLVDEDLVFKHRPFYLNFASGGRIWTRVYNNRDAIRGVNPDLIIYNDKDFPDE